jgi:hypothetical protein
MAANHQLSLPPMEAKSLVPTRTSDSPSVGQGLVPDGANGLSLLIAAVDETCSDKEASISLGLPDAAYWSKVKSGEKPEPRIKRLTDLPLSTQREYCRRWARQLGLRVSEQDAQQQAALHLVKAAVSYLEIAK